MAKSLRFIQCGDLHLGSPFHNLAAIDERWQRIVGKAPVRAFQKIVQIIQFPVLRHLLQKSLVEEIDPVEPQKSLFRNTQLFQIGLIGLLASQILY